MARFGRMEPRETWRRGESGIDAISTSLDATLVEIGLCILFIDGSPLSHTVMSKEKEGKEKSDKSAPQKTLKEKRAAKKAGKNTYERDSTS